MVGGLSRLPKAGRRCNCGRTHLHRRRQAHRPRRIRRKHLAVVSLFQRLSSLSSTFRRRHRCPPRRSRRRRWTAAAAAAADRRRRLHHRRYIRPHQMRRVLRHCHRRRRHSPTLRHRHRRPHSRRTRRQPHRALHRRRHRRRRSRRRRRSHRTLRLRRRLRRRHHLHRDLPPTSAEGGICSMRPIQFLRHPTRHRLFRCPLRPNLQHRASSFAAFTRLTCCAFRHGSITRSPASTFSRRCDAARTSRRASLSPLPAATSQTRHTR